MEKKPGNVRSFQEQLNSVMRDFELLMQKKRSPYDSNANQDQDQNQNQNDDTEEDSTDNTHGAKELPSPTFKQNFSDLDPERSNEQKIRELQLKEERITNMIKNAKKDSTPNLGIYEGEFERKRRMNNIIELQIAFQRQKKLVLRHQQDYRIHMAKLSKHQYKAFEVTKHIFEFESYKSFCRAMISRSCCW